MVDWDQDCVSERGSSTDVNNIQLLCGKCNRRKSNRYIG
jgi:5-methylcytosine-specific restriction endonuclease McrA